MCINGDERATYRLAANLKSILKERGITHNSFYNDTGIHIGRIISLERNIRLETLVTIADHLDITINDLTK